MNLFKKDDKLKYTISYQDPHADIFLSEYILELTNKYDYQHWVIVCIGTDRSTGDALGPLIGAKLSLYDFNRATIIGTLDNPVHALNLDETIQMIKTNYSASGVIAIDASLGQLTSVGNIQIVEGSLKPGAGVKKELTEIGDFHITGIVNVGGFMEYFVLQNTRLSIVMRMSEIISKSLLKSFLLNKKSKENVVNE